MKTDTMEIGRYDSRTHPTEFEIAPYGRMQIGAGILTLALVDCSVPAVQITADRHAMRLNLGGCIPINGHKCFIRNPYSFAIRGTTLQDLPISLVQSPSEVDPQFAENQIAMAEFADADPLLRTGLIVMPERGKLYYEAASNSPFNMTILGGATIDHLDVKPAGILTETGKGVHHATGDIIAGLVAIHGTYAAADIVTWMDAADGFDGVRKTGYDVTASRGVVTEDTAAVFWVREAVDFSVSINFYDQGDWNPEWRG